MRLKIYYPVSIQDTAIFLRSSFNLLVKRNYLNP